MLCFYANQSNPPIKKDKRKKKKEKEKKRKERVINIYGYFLGLV